MKQYTRHKTMEEVRAQCEAQGVAFGSKLYVEKGWDTVYVGIAGQGHVVYNTFNGKFFGATPTGRRFDSSSTLYEHRDWFQALLDFFMTNEPWPLVASCAVTVDSDGYVGVASVPAGTPYEDTFKLKVSGDTTLPPKSSPRLRRMAAGVLAAN